MAGTCTAVTGVVPAFRGVRAKRSGGGLARILPGRCGPTPSPSVNAGRCALSTGPPAGPGVEAGRGLSLNSPWVYAA